METTTTKQVYRIGVVGMDCRSCEQLLLKHISAIPGVTASSADAAAGQLTILADPTVSVEALASAIVAAGFTPQGLGETEPLVPVIDLTAEETALVDSGPDRAGHMPRRSGRSGRGLPRRAAGSAGGTFRSTSHRSHR